MKYGSKILNVYTLNIVAPNPATLLLRLVHIFNSQLSCCALQCVAVCCSVLQRVAVCCSVLQCVAVCCSVLQCVAVCTYWQCTYGSVLQCVRHSPSQVCCSVLQHVAVCCSVLQCVAMYCSVLQCVAVCCSVLQCVAVYCSVLQCVAVRCSVLQRNSSQKLAFWSFATVHIAASIQNLAYI